MNRLGVGVTTNYHYDDNKWYTTKEIDEVIFFKNHNGEGRRINDWLFFANGTDIVVSPITRKGDSLSSEVIGRKDDKVVIEANSTWADGNINGIDGIIVHGVIGQQVRWIGNFY